MQKVSKIFLHAIPNLMMIGLIPLFPNDYLLTIIYVGIIIISLIIIKCRKNDIIIFAFGFVVITFFEYIFISTGVETFARNSLLDLMPLWLPFLWAYGFVAIGRSIKILNN